MRGVKTYGLYVREVGVVLILYALHMRKVTPTQCSQPPPKKKYPTLVSCFSFLIYF